jgi:hypothetical protein
MSRTASFSIAKGVHGTQVNVSAPREMNEREAAVFMTALQKFIRGKTGCPTCISGTPIHIFEEEVERAVMVEL